jgi:hypothetical protein
VNRKGVDLTNTAERARPVVVCKRPGAPGRSPRTATGFNAMFIHRVRLTGVADVNDQLVGWLNHAYDNAG